MFSEKLAQAVSRLWRAAVVGVIVGGAAGYALSHLATAQYAAHADVLVAPAPGTRASDVLDERLLGSYAVILGGRQSAAAVHDRTGTGLSVTQVDHALQAEVLPDSTIVRVTATTTDPDTATELSRTAAGTFVEQLVDDGAALAPGDTPDEDAGPGAIVSVVEQSPAPSIATSPARSQWALWGALAGVVAAVGASGLRRLTDRRIRSAADLAELTDLPQVGAFGYDRSVSRQPLVSELDTHHPRFEAARIMRTNLQFIDVDLSSSVLTVTSSVPGEGKTTVAANVAIALARGGQSVILVEGDLRRPRLSALFDLPSSVGLTTALVGQVELDRAIRTTDVPGLDVLTSGTRPPNPSELLQTQAMSDLLTTLSRRYDVVLIDAPPLLPVTDGALLAEASDGALLVVRHGRTTHEQVRIAMDRLDGVGANLYGTVLTMVPARGAPKYGYSYGYTDAPANRTGRSDEGRRARR